MPKPFIDNKDQCNTVEGNELIEAQKRTREANNMISRQNYLEMAAIFNRMRPPISSRTKYKEWNKVREAFIAYLAKDNPNFDAIKFRMHTEVNMSHTPGGNIINLKDK